VDKTIAVAQKTIFYREEGKGLPVILVHGFAEDGAVWDQLVDQLKDSYRLLIPDLPGSGRSSLLTEETSMEQLAEDIRSILDAEGIEQCVLIGHSMGGYVTLAFAEKYPLRLKGFGLFHSTAFADSEEKKTTRRKSIEFIGKNGSAVFIRQSTVNLFAASTQNQYPEIISTMVDRYSNFSANSLVYYSEAMIRRPDRSAVLDRSSVPVLFIIGAQDQSVPPEQTLQQVYKPSLSHIHILENSGHMGMLEQVNRGSGILHSFLNFIITHE
jgi:pimeloyl-ACP methyl ester carboxylesterase